MILDELLDLVKDNPLDTQVKQICDRIISEEIGDKECQEKYDGPKGPNILLSLKCTEYDGQEIFVCLERESYGAYVVTSWRRSIKKKDSPLKRDTAISVGSITKAKSVLKVYATRYKFMKGE